MDCFINRGKIVLQLLKVSRTVCASDLAKDWVKNFERQRADPVDLTLPHRWNKNM